MKNEQRAVKVYEVLISSAHNRQTILYEKIGALVGQHPPGIAGPLKLVDSWCKQNGFPPLTVLVVQKGTGAPAEGFKNDTGETLDKLRERVFEHNWFGDEPVTPDTFMML